MKMVAVHDPLIYNEATKIAEGEKWQRLMREELDYMDENNTWARVRLPLGRIGITCMMILKCKFDCQGTIGRYKARLVIKAYVQMEGIDYDNTLAPVVPFEMLLLFMETLVCIRWHVHHALISTELLTWGIDGKPHVNCDSETDKHKKGLFGLKQSSRLWYKKLKGMLEGFGFKQLDYCECLFGYRDNNFELVIIFYVNGLVLLSADTEGMK